MELQHNANPKNHLPNNDLIDLEAQVKTVVGLTDEIVQAKHKLLLNALEVLFAPYKRDKNMLPYPRYKVLRRDLLDLFEQCIGHNFRSSFTRKKLMRILGKDGFEKNYDL